MSGRRISILLGVAAVLAAVIVACPAPFPRLKVEILREPGPVTTDYPLQVEHWSEPKVLALRRQENLDQVVAGATGEFDRFLRLMSWTRSQWPIGDPDPYPPCNGVDILAAIRSGVTGGFCGQYCYLLGDALKSFGYFSVRYVELETPAGESHFALEAWSNEHDRWVLLDPTYNVHYTDVSGTPLNALELHEALAPGRGGEIRAVEGDPPPADGKRIGEIPAQGLDYYSRFALSLRSDLAHLPLPLTLADREKMFVRWDSPDAAPFANMKFALATPRAADLYPGVAQVFIHTVENGSGSLRVELETRGSLPHFLAYDVRLDEGEWRRSGPMLEWEVPAGAHQLEAAAVNVAGVRGPVFGLRVTRRD